jgi:general secretion pathway protein N
MKKAWPLLTLGIAAYVAFAVVTLPAGVVLPRLESSGISTDGVSGTIWKGHAQVLRVSGAQLGSVRWDLHTLALFTGRLVADLELKRTDGFAKTLLAMTPSGRLTFDDLTASLPLSILPPNANRAGYTGTLNLKFAALMIEDSWPARADGSLEMIDLTGPAQRPANLGSFKVVFPPDAAAGDTLAGALTDLGGPVELKGTVQLKKAGRSYIIEGLIKTRGDAPQNLAKALEYLGPPDAEGRRPFSIAGTL